MKSLSERAEYVLGWRDFNATGPYDVPHLITSGLLELIAEQQKRIEELEGALGEIAGYSSWDFKDKKDPWKWCNEFIDMAQQALTHSKEDKGE